MSATGLSAGRGDALASATTTLKLRRALRPSVIVGVVGLLVLAVCAIAPSAIAPHDPNALSPHQLLPPVWAGGKAAYPLGTDSLGGTC